MKVVPVAGALLLTMAAILPFHASASDTPRGVRPAALAISRPLTGVVSWPAARLPVHEPGVLLVVGGGLMGLGSWLRRATAPRDGEPSDV